MLERRNVGIRQRRDAVRSRYGLDQDILSLAVKFRRHQADAGNIAAWPGQRGCKSGANHILGHDKQWYGLCRLLKRSADGVTSNHNHIRRSLNHRRHDLGDLLIRGQKTARDDQKVFAFDKTEFYATRR